jgi:hypothetical protein
VLNTPARVLISLIALLALPDLAAAQAARVQLQANRLLVQKGEIVRFTVDISVSGQSYTQYLPPSFKGFGQPRGQMTSRQISMINMHITRQERHVYEATPVSLGQIKVGPAKVRVQGRWVSSNTVTITVKGSGATPGQPGATPGQPGATSGQPGAGQPSGQVDPTTGLILPPGEVLPRVFIAARVSEREVFLGQQLVASWLLYTQADVIGFSATQRPTTDGFWSDQLESPRRLRFARKVLRERVYLEAVLSRQALFPQRSGELILGEMRADIRTLDSFSRSVSRQSAPIKITVKPLPRAGQPDGFPHANVGQFDVAASIDQKQVKVGEAITLRVIARGTGNIKHLELPKVQKLPGLQVYKPKTSQRVSTRDIVRGQKIQEYLLIARKAGKIVIPALTLHYFDPAKKQYRVAKTEPLTLQASGKAAPKTGGGAATANNVLGPDIRPPHSPKPLTHRPPGSLLSIVHIALTALPLLALIGFWSVQRVRQQLSRETERSLGRQVARKVRQHLQNARSQAGAHAGTAFFSELAAALREQLSHQMGERVEGLTREQLQRRLIDQSFPSELVDRLLSELDNCDFARFAPSASGAQQREVALSRTRSLLRDIASVKPTTTIKGREEQA